MQSVVGGTHLNRVIHVLCSYMTSCYSHPIFKKNQPTYHTSHTIRITYIPHFSHHSHHIHITLFTSLASRTSIYLPHFAYHLHHLPSATYHTFHTLRFISLHLSTTPFTSFTFTYLPHFPFNSHHQPSHIYCTFHIVRATYLHLSTALSKHQYIVPRSMYSPLRPAWRPVTAIWITAPYKADLTDTKSEGSDCGWLKY